MSSTRPRAGQGPLFPIVYLLPLLWAGLASAQGDDPERHYDARAALSRAVVPDPLRSQAQASAPSSLSADVQELSALEPDPVTGSMRSLSRWISCSAISRR
jgi:hypothetical protein